MSRKSRIGLDNWKRRYNQRLITHHSSLITHHSSLITHHSSLITHHSSLITFFGTLPLMPTWKLLIEYDGTRYRGWQEQHNARTLQATLRAAAEDLFKTTVDLGGSGRTDAGVHALGQVAHMAVRSAHGKDFPTPLKF